MSATFQHCHYVAIAKTIADMPGIQSQKQPTIIALSKLFEADNPAFDRERFTTACATVPVSKKDKRAMSML